MKPVGGALSAGSFWYWYMIGVVIAAATQRTYVFQMLVSYLVVRLNVELDLLAGEGAHSAGSCD